MGGTGEGEWDTTLYVRSSLSFTGRGDYAIGLMYKFFWLYSDFVVTIFTSLGLLHVFLPYHMCVHIYMYSRTGYLIFGPKNNKDLEQLKIGLSEYARPHQVFSATEVQHML